MRSVPTAPGLRSMVWCELCPAPAAEPWPQGANGKTSRAVRMWGARAHGSCARPQSSPQSHATPLGDGASVMQGTREQLFLLQPPRAGEPSPKTFSFSMQGVNADISTLKCWCADAVASSHDRPRAGSCANPRTGASSAQARDCLLVLEVMQGSCQEQSCSESRAWHDGALRSAGSPRY